MKGREIEKWERRIAMREREDSSWKRNGRWREGTQRRKEEQRVREVSLGEDL